MAEAYAPMRCTIEGWTSLTGMRPSVTRERILAGELPAVSESDSNLKPNEQVVV